ncbi:thiamine phosphate synthase [Roseovarius sp.]|uniref:thiamine phosphate synthase n=1 Tax=Roseovarius sp. TaxID=1486281 RepID=UPI0035162FDF
MERFSLSVSDVLWLRALVPLGVRFVQLRIKDRDAAETRAQIRAAREVCAAHNCQLVVNDYWQIALEEGCDFVHLGQEDMDSADFTALRRAGVRFGLSTHDETELDRALDKGPAYVALGPVYPTLLKKMKWGPQGLDRVRDWKARAGKVPLVAIGGLTPERLPGVFAAGADSAAVVTDIQRAADPLARTAEWSAACDAADLTPACAATPARK